MGVYVFNTQLLIPALLADAEDPNSKHDFGRDILPRIFTKYRVYAYNFIDENKVGAQYWRDVGTIEAYYEANMDLVSVSPIFNLYDKSWPLRTWQHQYPPVKTVFADPKRMGVGAGFHRRRRFDHFRRPRQSLGGGLRRAHQQLQRGGKLHPVQPREHRTPRPHSQRHHRPSRHDSRAHRNRLRPAKPTASATTSPKTAWSWWSGKNP